MKKHHRFFLLGTGVVVSLLLLWGIGWAIWLLIASKPDYAGHATMPGLSAEVDIYRDEYGVPHIFAANMNDAARALGYVHAGERLFQMEMQRRAGQGRLSEVVGSATVSVDKYIRTLNLYRLAESSARALSPEAQSLLTSYADGVNNWIETHRRHLPPEFTLLGFKPEPWKPADSVVWGKLMALQLSHNERLEVLRAELAKKLTPAQMQALFPPYGDAPVTLQPHMVQKVENTLPQENSSSLQQAPASQSELREAENTLGRVTGLDHAASNEWVIAGSRTASGKPILANDPHLGLGAPILWYLVRIVTPDLSVKGATVPGLPVVLLGQNDNIAWGMTTTGSDVEDLFIETLDPKNPDRYLTSEGSKPFEERTERIHVKDLNDVVLHARATRHGPVMSDIDTEMASIAGKGHVMALSFTGLGAQDTTSEALMLINRASGRYEFVNALKLYQSPAQNIVFADNKGDIGFINPGLVPVRASGDGLMPVEGESGKHDWTGTIPFAEWPQLYNPPAGFIFNANNEVAPPDPARYLGMDWEEPYRAERLQQFFNGTAAQTLDSSAAMQADDLSVAAQDLLPYLLKQKPTNRHEARALDMLRDWNGAMDQSRPEPLIFDAWLYEMHQYLMEKSGNDLKEKGPYAAASIAYMLAHDGSGFCDTNNCDPVIMKALDAALTLLKERDGSDMKHWRWGDEHITLLKNRVFGHIPILSGISDLSISSSGDFYTLDRGGSFNPSTEHPFARTHGGGYRAIYDLADPAKSRFMIATGESGHIFSKYYGNLTPLWNDVKSFTLTGTQDELAGRDLPELVLEP